MCVGQKILNAATVGLQGVGNIAIHLRTTVGDPSTFYTLRCLKNVDTDLVPEFDKGATVVAVKTEDELYVSVAICGTKDNFSRAEGFKAAAKYLHDSVTKENSSPILQRHLICVPLEPERSIYDLTLDAAESVLKRYNSIATIVDTL
jgi:hypothetical protein